MGITPQNCKESRFAVAGIILQKKEKVNRTPGFWTSFGELVLLAILLGAVTTVIDSVLGVVGLSATIKKLPIIGSNWTLIVSIAMMAVIDLDVVGGWGIALSSDWMKWVANGAIVMGMVPVKDAVVSMIGKGLRA